MSQQIQYIILTVVMAVGFILVAVILSRPLMGKWLGLSHTLLLVVAASLVTGVLALGYPWWQDVVNKPTNPTVYTPVPVPSSSVSGKELPT